MSNSGNTRGWEWGRSFSLSQKPCAAHGKLGCRCQRESARNKVNGKLPGHDRRAIDDVAMERAMRVDDFPSDEELEK